MIDFRYHVVSIIAVFLALGTGIVLGSTALDRPIIDDLKRRTEGLAADKARLQERVEDLEDARDDSAAVTASLGDFATAGRLTGQRVTVLSAPGSAIDVRDSIVAGVRDAGGRVTGQLRLLPRLLDPAAAAEIDDLVTRLATGAAPPTGVVARAAAELAAALDAAGAPDGAQPPPTTTRLVSAYREAELLAVDGSAEVRPGDLVVFVLPAVDPDARVDDSAAADRAVATMVQVITALVGPSPLVLVGPAGSAGDGGVLRVVRSDGALAPRLSSIDNAGTPAGTIAAVLALADGSRGGFGHYGTGPGAQAPLPALEPAPA